MQDPAKIKICTQESTHTHTHTHTYTRKNTHKLVFTRKLSCMHELACKKT